MSRTFLLVDCTFLCHRAFHTTGTLEYEGVKTGVMYGVIQTIELLLEQHLPDVCVFAFDWGGPGLRAQISPAYKASRGKDWTEEERIARNALQEQITKLHGHVLPSMGFNNVWRFRGYEGDDILAAQAAKIDGGDEGIIVTADNDLWQCLSRNVRWYNPTSKKMVTISDFMQEWGIDPCMWANVKALAGCSTDEVEGVRGIGESTAAKWFSGKLKAGKKYDLISQNLHVHNQNLRLVQLPYPGLKIPDVRDDEVTEQKKNDVKGEIGMRHRRVAVVPSGGFDI